MTTIRGMFIPFAMIAALASHASATIISTPATSDTPFTLGQDTLGEAATITASSVETFVPAKLNDRALGELGDNDNSTLGAPASITYTFDTTSHAAGYDISRIESYAGYTTDPTWGGRSNQGYAITLTFVDDSTATLVPKAVWVPCPVMAYWSQVVHTNSGGGVLNNGSSVTATGVKAITFSDFDPNWAYVPHVRYREFDVYGTATVPEPGTVGLAATGLLGLLAYAWRKRK